MLEQVIPEKIRITVPLERYAKKDAYIQAAEAFSRNMFRPIFIVDLFKKNYLYISDNFSSMFGSMCPEDAFNESGQASQLFTFEDVENLKTIMDKAYDLFLTFPVEERCQLIFSFYFFHHQGEKKRIVHQRMTPLALTDDGDLWLVLCTTSLSSRKLPGYYVMKVHNDNEYLQYNPERDRWYHKEGLSLSAEDKEILLLSSQGYTMKEIASILDKSEDAIKLCKRLIFAKLGVKSITEAVFAAINFDQL